MDTTGLLLLIATTCIAVLLALRVALQRQRRARAAARRHHGPSGAAPGPQAAAPRTPATRRADRAGALHFAARRAGYGLSLLKNADAGAAWFAPTEFQSTWPSIMTDGFGLAASTSPMPLDGR